MYSLDFYPRQGKLMFQTPTFSEDYAATMINYMLSRFNSATDSWSSTRAIEGARVDVRNEDVQFCLHHCTIQTSDIYKKEQISGASDVFFCFVAETRNEFVYMAKKARIISR